MELDWLALFAVSVSPLELVVRGSVMYCFLFLAFRWILRRDVGAIGIADVLLVVLVADAAQNAMGGEYRSITDGMVLVSTIIAWNIAIDWLAYRFPLVRRFLQPNELALIRDGRILGRNLRRELMTVEELLGKLREHGVDDLGEVRAAYMESDGEISVIKRKGPPEPATRTPPATPES
jgi:uncharacterized membrane protein YcaP (DUF421 family)